MTKGQAFGKVDPDTIDKKMMEERLAMNEVVDLGFKEVDGKKVLYESDPKALDPRERIE